MDEELVFLKGDVQGKCFIVDKILADKGV